MNVTLHILLYYIYIFFLLKMYLHEHVSNMTDNMLLFISFFICCPQVMYLTNS